MKTDSIVPEKPHEGLIAFVFPDSGREIFIRKVSPVLAMELRRKFPAPVPPLQKVNYGEEMGIVEEPNETHPSYLAAVEAHEAKIESSVRKLYLKRGVVIPKDQEEKAKEEVEVLKADWKEATGQELEGSWEYLYVSYVCVGSDEDLGDLLAAITRRSFHQRSGHSDGDSIPEAEI